MADGVANSTLQTVSQANSLFTFDLYKELGNGTDNLFFSPVSIQVILALVFLGARGNTAKQLARGLHLPEDRNVTEDRISTFMSQLQVQQDGRRVRSQESDELLPNDNLVLTTANRIFIKNGFGIKEEFNNSAIRLKAGIEEVDFAQEEQARKIINDWVENKTNQKIKDIISPGILNDLTRMVLVNTIYFLGQWESPFDRELTSPRPFHLASGSTKNVDMMFNRESFKYSEISELESQVALFPYKGERVSMMIILPREQNGLPNLESKLANVNLQDILSGMREQRLRVYLPKFRLEYKKELTETLQKFGMTDMFDAGRSDFTGVTDEPIVVSQVVHKAFVEVNEEGTEAAAATEAEDEERSMMFYRNIITFDADHPFVFLILDQQTHTVLFAGRYSTPPS